MSIDIIVILKLYLFFLFNRYYNGGIRIRYPFPNTETLYTTRLTIYY